MSIPSLLVLAEINLKIALCSFANSSPSKSLTCSFSYKSDLFPATPKTIFVPVISVANLYQYSKCSIDLWSVIE